MSDKQAIELIHHSLRDWSKWFIDFSCPDDEQIKSICHKAKFCADKSLRKMTVWELYFRYLKWRKSKCFADLDKEYFDCFMDSLVFDLGSGALKQSEKILFNENCNLTLKYLN